MRHSLTRRRFVQTASSAAFAIASSRTALASDANSALQIGLLGCGGRGAWIGNLFQKHANARVVAVHDYFQDMADSAGGKLGVPADKRYVGLNGYKELLASGGVDAVAVISPPYFHPEHAIAALEAGKHVFLAKPIAVDVAGCNAIVEAADKAGGKLSILVDFQTRSNDLYKEAIAKVHSGAIGSPVCGQVFYHTGRLGLKAKPGTETARLRNWVFDKALSGDIIVEQNIHVIDVANWILNAHPIAAWGSGGRKARVDVGDCWDHFVVTFRYPGDVLIDFSSTQFNYGFDDLCDRIFCTEGTVETHYGGDVFIKSKRGGWPGGKTDRIYEEGAVCNIKAFCAAIASGQPLNNVRISAESNLAAILGRMAAYGQRTVTWDEMMASGDKLDARLALPENGPATPREMPA
ncbi:MAG: Gfo/Idh/MocA family oxidoreductase [Candidatus Hydrogenedentes bacterium]|nr:Gfo/Idh/MocA family oxidoreductase [Candidatus Hydrogenedentota bacterium]